MTPVASGSHRLRCSQGVRGELSANRTGFSTSAMFLLNSLFAIADRCNRAVRCPVQVSSSRVARQGILRSAPCFQDILVNFRQPQQALARRSGDAHLGSSSPLQAHSCCRWPHSALEGKPAQDFQTQASHPAAHLRLDLHLDRKQTLGNTVRPCVPVKCRSKIAAIACRVGLTPRC